MRYTYLKTILTYIPISIREEENNDSQLLSWALQALRMISPSGMYQYNIALLEVKNHQVSLPDDLKSINLVTFACDGLDDSALKELCSISIPSTSNSSDCTPCDRTPEDFISRDNNICKYSLAYGMWLDSEVFNQNFEPITYIGNVSSQYLLNSNSPNRFITCNHTFSLDVNLRLTASFKEGVIAVDYKRQIMSDSEEFMIPDNPKLMKALAAYAEAQHWSNRANMHEEGAVRLLDLKLRQADSAMAAARGSTIMRNLNPEAIAYVTKGMGLSTIRVPYRYLEKTRNNGR